MSGLALLPITLDRPGRRYVIEHGGIFAVYGHRFGHVEIEDRRPEHGGRSVYLQGDDAVQFLEDIERGNCHEICGEYEHVMTVPPV